MSASLQSIATVAILAVVAAAPQAFGAPSAKAPIQSSAQSAQAAAPGDYKPVANPKAVVTVGHARFTVLTPQLIRIEWSADGQFQDHASFVFLNRRLPVPPFEHSVIGMNASQQLTLKTSALTLLYSPTGDGQFNANDLSITQTVEGKAVTWHPGMTNPENLQGTTRTLDGALGSRTKEAIGQGLISRSGWVLVDDSTRPLFDSANFSFTQGEKSPWPWVMERPADEAPGKYVDWYFFGYGHNYRQALGDYVKVAGRIPLPPRFAFGAWWSRYWDYTDHDILGIVKGFRQNDTPLDVFVIDMGWHISNEQLQALGQHDQAGQSLGWTGYTWNKVLFPDPTAFLAKLHADGLKTSLNLHPASGIQPWEADYPAMARAMGIDPATRQYVPFDPTSKKWAANYFNIVLHPLEKQGINFWWLDWQQQPMTKLPGVNNTWWLNYLHFTDQQREGNRPLLFHRWGGLGNHRYQIGFSGDTVSVWPSLAFQPWFTATAANVGYAYWSHDIGGHMPGIVGPELFTRWVQFGAFSPILRTHTTKNPDSERRIWAYPEPYSSILRSAFHLRYAMQPYIYTEARQTYDTGVAFFHPLYYDWPEANQAYTSKNEYSFGSQMIVDPVVTPGDTVSGLSTESVWLPEGDWIEWPTGRHFTGPVTTQRSFSISQIPVYVKAGAIVPMQPPMDYTGQKPVDPLIVNIWPLKPGESSHYSVYEDSGVSVEYQRGVFSRLPIRTTQTADTLKVEIGPVQGSFPGMLQARGYQLRLPADWPPASVTVSGIAILQAGVSGNNSTSKTGWSFEGNTLTTVIPVPRRSVHAVVTIEVRRAPALMASRADLDGFAGQMTLLREAYDAINKTLPVSVPPDVLTEAMQTGDRIGYHPESASAEIAQFHQMLPQVQFAVQNMAADFKQRWNAIAPDYRKQIEATNGQLHSQSWMDNLLVTQGQQRINAMAQANDLIQALSEAQKPQ
ncbi:MAG TPA: TIM-barrel domain-containing protein [Terracidiphilus sp.]|nr:TIM-barrel domain-containing protein [Terracidiphilus sp.]